MILESTKHRDEKQVWFCHLVVVMPDHVHLVVSFPDLAAFAPIVRGWKRWLSLQHGISWQENFFDHRMREAEKSAEKITYILQKPVRAKLVRKAEDWPYTWIA